MDASITHDRSRIKFPRGWSANTQLALIRTFFDDNDVIEKHFSLVIYFLSFIFGKLFIFDAVIKFLMVTFGEAASSEPAGQCEILINVYLITTPS